MADPNSTQLSEVTYLTGVTDQGTIASQSFWTWNEDSPATYGPDNFQTKWGTRTAGTGATILFAFSTAAAWTTTEKNAFLATLHLWSDVANVTFQHVSNPSLAQFTIDRATDGTAEGGVDSFYRSPIDSSTLGQAISGGISIDTSVAGFGPIGSSFSTYGGYPWTTMIHELGHVLGLGHSGAYDEGVTTVTTPYSEYDSRAWTVMSYVDPDSAYQWGDVSGGNGYYYARTPVTWMPLDILAVQRLYGLPTSSPLSGGQTFGFHSNIQGDTAKFFDFTINSRPVITIWDGGTGNTLDLSGFSDSQTVNLNPGTFSSVGGLSNNVAIAFGTRIDTGIGGSSADDITANGDGDVLSGGPSSDILRGGAGADVYRDTAANMAGDNLANFGTTDRIEVSDASLASFTYTLDKLSQTLTFGSGQQVSGVAAGTGRLVASAAAAGGVDLSLAGHDASLQDFNGDGHSDLLWRNVNGQFTTWDMQTNIAARQEIRNTYIDGSVSNYYNLPTTLDYNGDGYADLLFHSPAGSITTIWTGKADGGFTVNAADIETVSADWSIAGTGDFSGDGKDDLLWRNTSGEFTVWDSAADPSYQFRPNVYDNKTVATDWHVQAVADFNGDGKADILWRNRDGTFAEWQGDGTNFTPNVDLDPTVNTTWHLAGTADFNGDGKADLLWRNDNGSFTEWQSTGNGFAQNVYSNSTVATDWSIAKLGDYDGDGKADIMWRQNGGLFTVWQSTGNGFTPNVLIDSSVSTAWNVVAQHYDTV